MPWYRARSWNGFNNKVSRQKRLRKIMITPFYGHQTARLSHLSKPVTCSTSSSTANRKGRKKKKRSRGLFFCLLPLPLLLLLLYLRAPPLPLSSPLQKPRRSCGVQPGRGGRERRDRGEYQTLPNCVFRSSLSSCFPSYPPSSLPSALQSHLYSFSPPTNNAGRQKLLE